MSHGPFIKARHAVEADTRDPQQRNRLWWEEMPMTYVDWEADNRLPSDERYIQLLAARVLEGSPFLQRWFAEAKLGQCRVLDLGCGSGIFSCLLAKAGALVTAIDLTNAAVQLAKESTKIHEVEVRIARMDAEKMAFPDETFDFVFSWGVLHHTRNMNAAFQSVKRILRPGGRGMIMVYHRRSVVYYVHGLYWLLVKGKIFSGHTLASVQGFYTDGYYHRYLTRQEISAVLLAAGLRPMRIRVTQYEKKILPLIPRWLDTYLKSRFGMCLVAEFERPE